MSTMKRRLHLSLTIQGGIIFGAVMLCVVIVLSVLLLSGPKDQKDPASPDKVWAQVLTTADIERLESPGTAEPEN